MYTLILWLNVNTYITNVLYVCNIYLFRIVIKAAIVRLVANIVNNIFV